MGKPATSTSPIDRAAESFRYYADAVYPGRSPLYVSLASRLAQDAELLEIAARAWQKDALPNLFFAAVHFLLLKGEHHQLAAFYPSLNNTSRHYDFVYPYFRSFVLEHKDEIDKIITTHSVQTNEVGRCAVLVPAFELVDRQDRNQPISMIEIGSSAGLTLLWDRYHYRYGENLQCGNPNSPVRIECQLHGEKRPPVRDQLPKITSRIGIDLNPVDLNDAESVQWLRALVWPEHLKRASQLELAIQLARGDPPRVVSGNALELLPSLIDGVPVDDRLCIYHSFTLSLAGGEPKERLERLLAKASEKRGFSHISLEWAANSVTPILSLASLTGGERTQRVLAKCSAHGEWLEWL
jgi:hypothetical protein